MIVLAINGRQFSCGVDFFVKLRLYKAATLRVRNDSRALRT